MNLAFLAKLDSILFKDNTSFLSQILRNKYYHNTDLFSKPKQGCSGGLRSIIIGCLVFKPGLIWRLGDGKTIYFWLDNWVYDHSLLSLASRTLSEEEKSCKVKDFLSEGNWNLTKLNLVLSRFAVLDIIHLPRASYYGPSNLCIWPFHKSGCPTVNSIYFCQAQNFRQCQNHNQNLVHNRN